MRTICCLVVALSFWSKPAAAQPAEAARRVASAASAVAFPPARFQALLQRFSDKLYKKAFRHLGDERDFDHAHLLLGEDGRPRAILYHTQELAHYEPAGAEYAYIDADGRNWIQWLDRDEIENASAYARTVYPTTAAWDWFRSQELPGLREHHTILDKMLDPLRLGFSPKKSVQWVFTRKPCEAAESSDLRVKVDGRDVCLALTPS